ncbi:hemerythrin domain-containing protein [Nocardioides jensenii]|uniref:hemerythrin domain-containing protein n=1 Tax=Nocardioides jensenii TaxID=1843 RepID=UPI00083748D6|nr:hemerythrin domain-containing protein [Nocardioides jensenii]
MCEHCGCRGIEPIASLMDEHYAMLDLSGDIRRCLAAREMVRAGALLAELGRQLVPHASREERGVFAALKHEGEFVEEVLELEADHAAFDDVLADLDPAAPDFRDRVEVLLQDLSLHIDRENLGIFPVAVVTLGGAGWDLVTRAHGGGLDDVG